MDWHVVRVLGAEAGEHDLALVGLLFAGRRAQVQEVGVVGDVDAAVAGFEAGRDEQAVGEHGCLVGFAHTLGVFEDDDLVVLLGTRFDLRVRFAARDPQPALGVEVHLDRLGEQRVGGEQVDLEAVSDLE